jgi:signal transduction histidine kinase
MSRDAAGEVSGRAGVTVGGVLVVAAGMAAALGATLLLRPWLPHTQFVLFYGAIALASAVGGLRLAFPTLVLSVVIAEVAVIEGYGIPALGTTLFLRVALLVAVALGIILLVDRLQRARHASQEALLEVRRQAERAESQAAELQAQVAESGVLAAELRDVNRRLAEQMDGAERTAARAARLQRLTARLLDTVGEGPVTGSIAREARRAADASVAAVALPAEGGGVEVRGVDARGPDAADLQESWVALMTDVVTTGTARWVEPETEAAGPALAVLPLGGEQGGGGAILFAFRRPGGFAPDERWFTALVAQECAEALERARLHGMGMRALVRAEFAERRLAFLAEASARMAASLDYREALGALARMTVPELTDCCMVHLMEEGGGLRLVDVAHSDHGLEAECRALEEAQPGAACAVDLQRVVDSGDVALVEFREGVGPDDAGAGPEHLRRLGMESQLVVPIILHGRGSGAITLAGETTRTFSDADRTLAVELARRAAQAVQNARLYQAAAHASEAKSNFLAVISHELRTPLNAIIGYADLLLLGIPKDLPEQTRRQVERIRFASDGLLHLVEEVLSFSRIEAGKEVLRVSPLDLSGLLRDAVTMITPMAAEKGLSLQLQLPDEPIRVVSDEHKIRQVVTNLLSNAVKFTDRGGIQVSGAISDGSAVVEVRDTGIGIAAGDIDRIFDPFWQVEPAATRRFGGTGLGLGVARKLVRLLEGRLDVSSEVGRGSAFTLVLPLTVMTPANDA